MCLNSEMRHFGSRNRLFNIQYSLFGISLYANVNVNVSSQLLLNETFYIGNEKERMKKNRIKE